MISRDDRSTLPRSLPPPDDWAAKLVRHTARRSPANLSERLEEEWLADLHEHSGWLSRLRFALGCCRASWVIGRDAIACGAPLARTSVPPGAVATYSPRGDSGLSRRTIALMLITGLHVLAIYGFSAAFGTRIFEAPPPSFRGEFIADPRQPDALPPAPERTLDESPHLQPDLRQLTSIVGPITYYEDPLPTPAEPPAMPPEPVPIRRVIGGPGNGFPSTGDFYPALSRTLGESGVAAVRVCVDRNGRLTADPQISQSSGSARLDAGALALAKAGSGHYRSTTENGQPVASCYPFRIRFALTN